MVALYLSLFLCFICPSEIPKNSGGLMLCDISSHLLGPLRHHTSTMIHAEHTEKTQRRVPN